MRRLVIVTVAIVVVLLVLGQVLLPPYLEHRVAQRLTKQGGSANVQLSAFPAERLLFKEGSKLRVRARGITTDVAAPGAGVLKDVDGFGTVDMEVSDSRAGPLKVATFELRRNGGGPYRAVLDASITASDLSAFGGGQLAGPLGTLFGGIAGGALPFGNQPIPISVSADLVSDNGVPRATTVQGAVAGIPAGALLEALAAAVGARI